MSDKFTVEDGDTLYFGRSNVRHGFNLGQLTDRSFNALDVLNAPVVEMARLGKANERLTTKYEKIHQFAVGLFWAGEAVAEKTVAEIKAYGLDARHEIERLKSEDKETRRAYAFSTLENVRLTAALEEIAKGEGRYAMSPLEHAENTIEDMKALATAALDQE